MRIWSMHPKYLDSKGIVALWRESLLAKNVLLGNTKGYRNHPQLSRFKKVSNSSYAIDAYLSHVYFEAKDRGYQFNREKIDWDFESITIPVTTGQIKYEYQHLLNKLKVRDKHKYKKYKNILIPDLHPLFNLIEGGIEEWEII